jgi:hydrogenase maturation protein HypF
MRKFMMCPKCHQEYEDPLNRRFHAQPNACPECGPVLTMVNTEGKRIATNDVVKAAAKYLKEGKIIAIKGLGGFLLACDARSDIAVNELRIRKQRPHKPLAIMVKDIAEALKYCKISAAEKSLLQSPQAPIVLLQRKTKSAVSGYVAPNNRYLGVMLPYTPLHHILLTESGIPLVMTSGNRSEEPIVGKNEEALQRLAGIADFFLMHNRDIHSTYDDSVTRIEDKKVETIRRARGFAPYPVRLPFTVKQILACGAEEKNTFCLTRDSYAFISQHIGDMENLDTLEHFDNTISLYRRLFRIEPEIIACDMHPEYLSTRFALEQAARLSSRPLAIQHHHAHIASCMAENKHESPVIGVALDGTGYGTDETIWGGEFLVADFATFERIGQLEYLPLPGGAAAIMQPYRTAIGYLQVLMGDAVFSSGLEFLKKIGSEEINFIRQQVYSNFNAPPTSSMGRLFDAVSALIGIRDTITFEAQAAIDLEMAAYSATGAEDCSYPFAIVKRQGVSQIKIKGILEGVVNDLLKNVPTAEISLKFHTTVANIIVEMCRLIREKTLLKTVALSGGVFQNRLLLKMAKKLLKSSGFAVLSHRQVPCNDGGISLGQAAIAGYIKR